MRNSFLTVAIVGVMSLAACMSAAEKTERDAKLAQVRAEALARFEQAKQEQAQRSDAQQVGPESEFIQWQKDNEPYIRSLCTTPPGNEHDYAWENYRIAVSVDDGHAADALKLGRLIHCSAPEKISGFRWSTRPVTPADQRGGARS